MKTYYICIFKANFQASVTLLFFSDFHENFHQNVELKNWNDIHHFGKFLLIFELGRGRYLGPKSGLGKSLVCDD